MRYRGELIGYARTTELEQEAGLHAQLAELKALKFRRIFEEKGSSVDTFKRIRGGDQVHPRGRRPCDRN